MLIRIATWSLGAVLACSLVASAEAAPARPQAKPSVQKPVAKPAEPDKWRMNPRPAATPQQRMHPLRSISKRTPMTSPVFVDEGRIERAEEGLLLYSVEIPLETREEMAKFKGVPLSRIPERSFKTARISAHTLSERDLKKKVGDAFRIELRQDPKGFVYATGLSAAKTTQRK